MGRSSPHAEFSAARWLQGIESPELVSCVVSNLISLDGEHIRCMSLAPLINLNLSSRLVTNSSDRTLRQFTVPYYPPPSADGEYLEQELEPTYRFNDPINKNAWHGMSYSPDGEWLAGGECLARIRASTRVPLSTSDFAEYSTGSDTDDRPPQVQRIMRHTKSTSGTFSTRDSLPPPSTAVEIRSSIST